MLEALTFWQEYGKDLGIGLTSLIYVLTPEAIVIGGGVSASFEFFLPAMKAEIEKRVHAYISPGFANFASRIR